MSPRCCAVIQQLGETLKLRQQVVATATVFLKRFYARYSLKCIDPLLLAPTSVFLASKVEECGVISNNRLISTCQAVGSYQFLVIFHRNMTSKFDLYCISHFFGYINTCLPGLTSTYFFDNFLRAVKNKFGYAYNSEFPYRMNQVLECEFYLLENMDCCLIVYQPYR